ncbi:MAG: rRNA adenine N(6)-methyltransferase family protein [Chloroflexi bacterium]|nr:rRNA adenine N(6)-methyltransferase family protein [Chloroflexota bacterium]
MANKLLGQHFLRNAAVAEKIAHAVMPRRGEIVFEIGAGHGELTRLLARTCTVNGARLLSIEKDAALADALSGSLAPGENGAIEIVHGDALKFFASARLKEEVRNHPYRVVGNIPYYLTGRLLRILSEVERWPVRCVIMIQREVAERIMAQPPHMNRLAASVQFWAEPSILTTVSKENFQPMPAVDSAVIMLDSKNTVFSARYYAAVRALFAQPRTEWRRSLQ